MQHLQITKSIICLLDVNYQHGGVAVQFNILKEL